ncbi:Homeodomain containing protein PHTF1/2, N-terminal [Popillia japonica]|uniref:Homeodomain containing protein PHTF1/2, N-terminal n=1 Tax=Popillia japonica TaxID=7064 RepID=A0AAW1KM24_POPJA
MGMDSVAWYQKKIATYDKQEWEKIIEQRILDGVPQVQMKSTKLKENYIDLDLIRGSSFTKAKPKHGFLTVAQLATLRLIFLPYYSKWLVRQISRKVYLTILTLYLLEILSIILYVLTDYETVPVSELLIPVIMMWILIVIQSQIGATNPDLKLSFKESFSRKHVRRKYKRKTYLNSEEKSDLACNSLNEEEDDESSEVEKSSELSAKIRCDKKALKLQRSKLLKKPLDIGIYTHDDGFESFRSNATSSSDNNDESRVPRNMKSYLFHANQYKKFTTTKNTPNSDSFIPIPLSLSTRRQSEPNLVYRTEIETLNISKCYSHNSEKCTDYSYETDDDNWIGVNSISNVIKKRSDCTGITTNSSDIGESDSQYECTDRDYTDEYDIKAATLTPLCLSRKEAVSCTIWKNREVETMPNGLDYFYLGAVLSTLLALLPALCRLCNSVTENTKTGDSQLSVTEVMNLTLDKFTDSFADVIETAFGNSIIERIILMIATLERLFLSFFFFFMLSVAERTFKQRFLYAKFFTHLTSSRRAKNSELPHFRLNKVCNIKTWLSVRSYLKKRGPLRSVDVIVSSAFIITIVLLSFLSMELLKDSITFHSQYNLEAMVWSIGLGIFLLRFLTLGTKINKKYRNFSVLITEQINLYLQIEQKPRKKEELMVANSVLKLAADLLKELESPFKILGLSANPILYTLTKVFILSALSAVLSELLGFKLKLHKIKLK